jgi:hypothetical protein
MTTAAALITPEQKLLTQQLDAADAYKLSVDTPIELRTYYNAQLELFRIEVARYKAAVEASEALDIRLAAREALLKTAANVNTAIAAVKQFNAAYVECLSMLYNNDTIRSYLLQESRVIPLPASYVNVDENDVEAEIGNVVRAHKHRSALEKITTSNVLKPTLLTVLTFHISETLKRN